jgi:hypothetical protein
MQYNVDERKDHIGPNKKRKIQKEIEEKEWKRRYNKNESSNKQE